MRKMEKDNSLFSHFSELRLRIIKTIIFFTISFLILYPFSNYLFEILLHVVGGKLNLELIAIEIASPFIAPLRLVLFLAFVLTMPFLVFQVLSFMSPGLYENERKFVYTRSVIGTALFLIGILFSLFIVLPNVINFFQNIGPNSLIISTDISKFLSFFMLVTISFGIAFQVPLLVNALIFFNIIKKEKIKSYRGIVLIIIFFIGMVLTPPDVISQILLAVPMYLLFEIGLLFSYEKKKPSG